jgi:holdfast attachment protein HfaA
MKRLTTVLSALQRPAIAAFAVISVALIGLPDQAQAQSASSSGQFNIPYGKSYNDFNQPFDARTRDANGNRTIVNGRMFLGQQSNLSLGIGGGFFGGNASSGVGGFGGAGAIGNQLNVVTVGSWNTVIIDSTQINNGNQNVNISGSTQTLPTPPSAADQPFTTASQSAQTKGLRVQAVSPSGEELNGGLRLND